VRYRGAVVGALNVYAHAKNAFGTEAVRIGELFARPAAVSVRNAQILAQSRGRAGRRLTVMVDRRRLALLDRQPARDRTAAVTPRAARASLTAGCPGRPPGKIAMNILIAAAIPALAALSLSLRDNVNSAPGTIPGHAPRGRGFDFDLERRAPGNAGKGKFDTAGIER
jgi:hypothetical protein